MYVCMYVCVCVCKCVVRWIMPCEIMPLFYPEIKMKPIVSFVITLIRWITIIHLLIIYVFEEEIDIQSEIIYHFIVFLLRLFISVIIFWSAWSTIVSRQPKCYLRARKWKIDSLESKNYYFHNSFSRRFNYWSLSDSEFPYTFQDSPKYVLVWVKILQYFPHVRQFLTNHTGL